MYIRQTEIYRTWYLRRGRTPNQFLSSQPANHNSVTKRSYRHLTRVVLGPVLAKEGTAWTDYRRVHVVYNKDRSHRVFKIPAGCFLFGFLLVSESDHCPQCPMPILLCHTYSRGAQYQLPLLVQLTCSDRLFHLFKKCQTSTKNLYSDLHSYCDIGQ